MVKQITSPGGMHETSARAWCTGKTQRNWVESEVGGGIGMGNTCNSMADSCQCMTKPTKMLWISLQLININEKKKEHISGTRNLKKKKRRRIAQVPYEVAVVQSLVLSYISPPGAHREITFPSPRSSGGVMWLRLASKMWATWQVWLPDQGNWEQLCSLDFLSLHLVPGQPCGSRGGRSR